ncbi:MAG: amidohydrolase [Acholeplasmataceae bacterium]
MKHWKKGTIHTLREPGECFLEMITDGGVIKELGSDLRPDQDCEVIDLKGGHVYPGFVDAHLHLLGYGQMLTRPNLRLEKNRVRVLRFIEEQFKGEPLFIEGYFDIGLEAYDLNAISLEQPILLRHNDYHSVTVNQVVLDRIGSADRTGILTEEAAEAAMRAVTVHTKERLTRMLEAAIDELHAYGITGGHSEDLAYYNGFDETLGVFQGVLSEGAFRAHLLVHHEVLDDYERFLKEPGTKNDFLELGAVKVFYDGTFSSKTALMHEAYLGSRSNGLKIFSDQEFEDLVKRIRSLGLTLAIHVIGDRGLDEVVDWLRLYPPKAGQKDRIIHASVATVATIKKLSDMPVTLDIQPQFLSSDLPWALDLFEKPPQKVYPWKTYLENGIICSGSSDAPVEEPDPLLGMHAAITRLSKHDHSCYYRDEKLTAYEALLLYTRHANAQTKDRNRGMIAPGYIADFTITSKDLETVESDALKEHLVIATVIDERFVYDRRHNRGT